MFEHKSQFVDLKILIDLSINSGSIKGLSPLILTNDVIFSFAIILENLSYTLSKEK